MLKSTLLYYPLITLLVFSPLVIAEPQSAKEILNEANQLLSQGKIHDAISQLNLAIENDPKNYISYFKRATANLSIGKNIHALQDFSKVLELKPDQQQALLQRIKLYIREGSFSKAKKDLYKLNKLTPGSQDVLELKQKVKDVEEGFHRVEREWNHKRYDSCIEYSESVISQIPLMAQMRLVRGHCYLGSNRLQDAIVDYSRALALNPSDIDISLLLAKLEFLISHDLDKANHYVKQCLQTDPDNKLCFKVHKSMKKYKKQTTQIDIEFQKKKYHSTAKLIIGNYQKKEAESMEDSLLSTIHHEYFTLKKELNVDVSSQLLAHLYSVTCQSFSKLKNSTHVLKWCSEALKHDDKNVEALIARADVYLEQEEYDLAIADLNQAQQLGGPQAEIRKKLQKAMRLQKQASRKDYYQVLGVDKKATKQEIKKAFRKLAQKWHPDTYRGELEKEVVEKKMAEINEAYEVLSNEEKREQFDNGFDPNNPHENQGYPFQQGGFGGSGFEGNPFEFFFSGGGFPFGSNQGSSGSRSSSSSHSRSGSGNTFHFSF